MRKWIVALALASAGTMTVAGEAGAQVARPAAAGDLTLARVFGSPDLSGSQPRGVRLSPDGTLLTFLRPRADEKELPTCGRATRAAARSGCWSTARRSAAARN